MTKRLGITVLAVLVLILGLFGTSRAGDTSINLRFSGTSVGALEMQDALQNPTVRALTRLPASGNPGPATVLGLWVVAGPPTLCLDGEGLLFEFGSHDVVITFDSASHVQQFRSQIFASLDQGSFCVDLSNGVGKGTVDFTVTGGARQYKNATGTLTMKWNIRPTSDLIGALKGRITGTVTTP